MRKGTRRDFLQAAGFAITCRLTPLGSPTLYLLPWTLPVEVQHVAAFSGPFLLRQLKVGRRLEVVWVRDRPCVAMNGHLLGLLAPDAYRVQEHAVPEKSGVRLARVDRDSKGRLLLFVQVTP